MLMWVQLRGRQLHVCVSGEGWNKVHLAIKHLG